LICCCPNEIGCKEEAEGEEGCGAKMNGDEELECDDGESEVFCKRFVATEFCYLFGQDMLRRDGWRHLWMGFLY
jgi:hypothetical protein